MQSFLGEHNRKSFTEECKSFASERKVSLGNAKSFVRENAKLFGRTQQFCERMQRKTEIGTGIKFLSSCPCRAPYFSMVNFHFYLFCMCIMVFYILRERMEAMEKQIASLTGLVQSVLTRGPDSP